MTAFEYGLGHHEREIRRLEVQGEVLAPGTERILRAAGLGAGQRVLDIGAGAGDVAMIAGRLVGASGSVLGIDPDAEVLERARSRSAREGLDWISYEVSTLEAAAAERRFDAVVSRYVALFQPDRAAFLRQAAAHLRPGGTLVVIEPGAQERVGSVAPPRERWSHPPAELFDRVRDLSLRAFGLMGAKVETGRQLVGLFRDAGLPEPSILQEVPTGGPASPVAELLCLLFESQLPVLEKHGVVSALEIGLGTLLERVRADAGSSHSQLRFYDLIGAWTTVS